MNTEKTKKIFTKTFITTLLFISILVVIFFILELIDLPLQYKTFFSFLLLGGIVYTVHLSVDRHKLLKKELLFLFSCLVIVNRLYDTIVFESIFPLKAEYAVIITFIVCILMAICPLIIHCIKWITNRIIKDDEDKIYVRERNIYKDRLSNPTTEKDLNNEFICTVTGSSIPHSIERRTKIKRTKMRSNIGDYIFSSIILIISILVTYLFISQISAINNLNSETIMHNIDSWIPILLLGGLSTIVVFIIICAYLKLIRAMVQIVNGNDSPIIYATGLFVISAFLTETGYFNQDKMLNILTQGDLFSIPVAALIIYPFFVLSVNAINQLFKNKNIYNRMVDRTCQLAKKILVIVYNIMDSLIELIGFSTSSVLNSMVQLIKSDDEMEEKEDE